MRQYAVDHDIMSQSRKSLVGSMFGEKIMVISPLLKWYVEHGLKVTQIHQVVKYTPATCFQKFGEQVSEARRAGDADPNKKITAETNKLDGNSSYGKTVTNKERHTDVIYCQGHHVSRYLVDPSFRKCNQLSAKTFEVEMSKRPFDWIYPCRLAVLSTSTPSSGCWSFTMTSWMCLWIVRTSSIAAWTRIVHIWLCPLPVWKK